MDVLVLATTSGSGTAAASLTTGVVSTGVVATGVVSTGVVATGVDSSGVAGRATFTSGVPARLPLPAEVAAEEAAAEAAAAAAAAAEATLSRLPGRDVDVDSLMSPPGTRPTRPSDTLLCRLTVSWSMNLRQQKEILRSDVSTGWQHPPSPTRSSTSTFRIGGVIESKSAIHLTVQLNRKEATFK